MAATFAAVDDLVAQISREIILVTGENILSLSPTPLC